jgi:hypothetical protein
VRHIEHNAISLKEVGLPCPQNADKPRKEAIAREDQRYLNGIVGLRGAAKAAEGGGLQPSCGRPRTGCSDDRDGTNDAPALAQATSVWRCIPARIRPSISDPTKLIDLVWIGKQMLITRGALTTFSIANDVAKYFAIIPACS